MQGDHDEVRNQIDELGVWGPLLILALAVLHAVVFYPAEIVDAAAGFAYGFFPALALVMIGWLLNGAHLLGDRPFDRPAATRPLVRRGALRAGRALDRARRGDAADRDAADPDPPLQHRLLRGGGGAGAARPLPLDDGGRLPADHRPLGLLRHPPRRHLDHRPAGDRQRPRPAGAAGRRALDDAAAGAPRPEADASRVSRPATTRKRKTAGVGSTEPTGAAGLDLDQVAAEREAAVSSFGPQKANGALSTLQRKVAPAWSELKRKTTLALRPRVLTVVGGCLAKGGRGRAGFGLGRRIGRRHDRRRRDHRAAGGAGGLSEPQLPGATKTGPEASGGSQARPAPGRARPRSLPAHQRASIRPPPTAQGPKAPTGDRARGERVAHFQGRGAGFVVAAPGRRRRQRGARRPRCRRSARPRVRISAAGRRRWSRRNRSRRPRAWRALPAEGSARAGPAPSTGPK